MLRCQKPSPAAKAQWVQFFLTTKSPKSWISVAPGTGMRAAVAMGSAGPSPNPNPWCPQTARGVGYHHSTVTTPSPRVFNSFLYLKFHFETRNFLPRQRWGSSAWVRPSGDVREVRIRGLGLVPAMSINKDVQSAPRARRADRDGEQKPGQKGALRRPLW